jgi:hypothetical protein
MKHDQKIMTMFDLALELLYDSQLEDAMEKVRCRKLDLRGRQDGNNAASWFFSGDTSEYDYARILKGIEDGDPAVCDHLPAPRIGGEFADDSTWDQILKEELEIDIDEPRTDDNWLSAYESGFHSAVQDYIVRVCRYQLGHIDEVGRL